MNARIDHLLTAVARLPVAERSALVVALMDSLEGSRDPSISDAWLNEVLKRREALRAGQVQTVAWSAARSRLAAL